MWFGTDLAGQPWGKAALIRVLGSIMIAAGCCAAGFAAIDQPSDRRYGLFWFAVAHAVICLVVLTQRMAVWGPGPAETILQVLGAISSALFYLWLFEGDYARGFLVTLFGGPAPDSSEPLRSQYEQQIREAAKQEERNRLARDLHDSIKQQIFVIQTAAATAQARFDQDQVGAKEALDQVRNSARDAMTEMQVMLDQLRSVPLENAGLIESLKKQCETLGFRTGARVDFDIGNLPAAESLPPGAHEAILRAAQEALANVARHARARSVSVSLKATLGDFELRIEDDGAGFDPNQGSRGQGIANMHARAEEFGGKFELISHPDCGTSIVFSIPYKTPKTPREYMLRAVGSGVLLLIALTQLVPTKSMGTAAFAVIAALGVVRYLMAYRRVQAAR
jgi:signal transduction histidine kinase